MKHADVEANLRDTFAATAELPSPLKSSYNPEPHVHNGRARRRATRLMIPAAVAAITVIVLSFVSLNHGQNTPHDASSSAAQTSVTPTATIAERCEYSGSTVAYMSYTSSGFDPGNRPWIYTLYVADGRPGTGLLCRAFVQFDRATKTIVSRRPADAFVAPEPGAISYLVEHRESPDSYSVWGAVDPEVSKLVLSLGGQTNSQTFLSGQGTNTFSPLENGWQAFNMTTYFTDSAGQPHPTLIAQAYDKSGKLLSTRTLDHVTN